MKVSDEFVSVVEEANIVLDDDNAVLGLFAVAVVDAAEATVVAL